MTDQAGKSVLERISDLEAKTDLLLKNSEAIKNLQETVNLLSASALDSNNRFASLNSSSQMNNKFLTALIRGLRDKDVISSNDLMDQINKLEDDEKSEQLESMKKSGMVSEKQGPAEQGDLVAFSTNTLNTETGTTQKMRGLDFVVIGNDEIPRNIEAGLIGKSAGDSFVNTLSGKLSQVFNVSAVYKVTESKENTQGE